MKNLPSGTITFLFTDVTDSTRLWEKHPTDMSQALTRHDEIIDNIAQQHKGYLVRPRGEGDSRFVVFERAIDGVQAAAAVQQTLHEEDWPGEINIFVRMAVHTGEGEFRDGDYYGPAVNRCAKMRTITHGGQTILSQAVNELVQDILPEGIELFDLGKHPLEGVMRPENIYQLMAPGLPINFPPLSLDQRQINFPTRPPPFLDTDLEQIEIVSKRPVFVAREKELSHLGTLLEKTIGREGQILFISGGAGRGKTALINEFSFLAQNQYADLITTRGICNAHSGIGDPYLPFRDITCMLSGDIEASLAGGSILPDHARRLWNLLPHTVDALLKRGPSLIDVLVHGDALLERTETASPENVKRLRELKELVERKKNAPSEMDQNLLFEQFTNVLLILAERYPFMLFLDDLQWADRASIDLLYRLGRRIEGHPILIIGAYRPDEVALGRDGERHPLENVINELKRLYGDISLDLSQEDQEEDFVKLLLDTEPNQLGADFRRTLKAHTGGHPLFTVELLREMKDREDLIKDEQNRWIEGPGLAWDMLPSRVEAVIEERVKRLDDNLKEVLSIASVEGEEFTVQVISQVQNVKEINIQRKLSQQLEKIHNLVFEGDEVKVNGKVLSHFRFRHQLYQHYLYNDLSAGERRLLHEDIGIAMEKIYEGKLDEMAVQLAHHFHAADVYDRAFHYYSLAGKRATRLYANGEAIAHYTQAIELAEMVSSDEVTLAELHRGRGLASETLGNFKQARSDHTTAFQIAQEAGEHLVEWRSLTDLGKLWRSRDYDEARDYFDSALELARQVDDPTILANSLNWVGNWYANIDNTLKAVEYHHEALKIVEQLGNQQELAITLDLLGMASLLGGDTKASVQYYNRAIAIFRELDDRPRLTTSLLGRASNFSLTSLLSSISATPPRDPAIDLNEVMQIAIEIDSAPDQAWMYWARGQLHTRRCQFNHALKDLQCGLQIALEIEHREFIVANRFGMGELYNELLAPEIALEQLEESLNLARELNSQSYIHSVIGALAKTYIILNNLGGAQSCLSEVLSPQTPMDTLGKRYCWTRLGELALAQGKTNLALDIAERLIASTPGAIPEQMIPYLWKLKGESLAAMGHMDEAVSLLQTVIENSQGIGEQFFLWRVHASLGRLYFVMKHQELADKESLAARSLVNKLANTIPDEVLREGFLQRAYQHTFTTI
jgi:class 3 adenylate cyclase/tetratricopeptide (TPR) repeat protein